ncbi:MAG: hypothetical protein ACE10D_04110 [Planctomycetota bacterium]
MPRRSLGLLGVVLLIPVAWAADDPLRGASLRTRIAGPEVTAKDLEGKVVFFEYWGSR